MEVSQNKLARDMGVSPHRIDEIVPGLRSVTADTDLRLSHALGSSEGFWFGLQNDFDLEQKKFEVEAEFVNIVNLASNISGADA